MQFGGPAATFAVSRLRKVGELEIDRESFGDAMSFFNGEPGDDLPRLPRRTSWFGNDGLGRQAHRVER
jgi:hypothetical protein